METYRPDIDASQIVRWLIEDQDQARSDLIVYASRAYAVEDAELQTLGEEESEDLSDIIVIGDLEVRPSAEADGWVLRLQAEDRIGSRLPDGEDVMDAEEEIDLETFEEQFILPAHIAVDVLLEAEDPQAEARFTSLFKHMLKNEHERAQRQQ